MTGTLPVSSVNTGRQWMKPGTWQTSSYSTATGQCVEVGWYKSSYCTTAANCVEVRTGAVVGVRDTKDRTIPAISVGPEAWVNFLAQMR
jgi:hypothetical protein